MGKLISAINAGSLPIKVYPGDKVASDRVIFHWEGPASSIYLCWGLWYGGAFNHGSTLVEAHNFASALISVPEALNGPERVEMAINAELTIPLGTPPAKYNTQIWLAYEATDQQDLIIEQDQDDEVFWVLSDVGKVEGLEIAYKKV